MLRTVTFIMLILISFSASAKTEDSCVEKHPGFLSKIKSSFINYQNTKAKNLSTMKENDKTPFVGEYHTVSSCGVFTYNDPFRGGDIKSVVVNKVYNEPGNGITDFNIKNQKGTISGKAHCMSNAMRGLKNLTKFKVRSRVGDKGAGVIHLAMSIVKVSNTFNHICYKTGAKFYTKEFEVQPHKDGIGGLLEGKRRYPGMGTFGPSREENNVRELCGKLRGNTMIRTNDGGVMCLGYSGDNTDEITVYVTPSSQPNTQRIILRKKSAFNKGSIPECRAKEWYNTRWTTSKSERL